MRNERELLYILISNLPRRDRGEESIEKEKEERESEIRVLVVVQLSHRERRSSRGHNAINSTYN